MAIWKRIAIILLVSSCCIGCDQTTKYYTSEHLQKNTMASHLNDTLRIGYTENRGVFLGLGKDLPAKTRFLVFTVLTGIFLVGFLFYLVLSRKLSIAALVGLSCMFSGGASNLFDRAMNDGAVVDFINVGFGPVRTGIFNIADMAILFGALLFFVVSVNTPENQHRELKS